MTQNVDQKELDKFSQLADEWWNPNGEFHPLHSLNPVRLDYINHYYPIENKQVLDVGCGGGILSESMALQSAQVTAIDLAEKSLQIARTHAAQHNVNINYQCITVETLAETQPETFNVVTCMEMLEHVPDPQSIVSAIGKLVKPGGWVFFSTLNRTAKSYVLAVIGAEYILGLLRKGTHDYKRFIRPSELTHMAHHNQLQLINIQGVTYQPFMRQAKLSTDTSINYMMALQKTE